MTTIIVSGGFDPIHVGHIRLMQNAKKLGSHLIVLVNNDNWIEQKKGQAFMPESERCEVIAALECVDEVMLTTHLPGEDRYDCSRELKKIQFDVFANGGDRTETTSPEHDLCLTLGKRVEYGVGGGKVQSSSWLISGSR